MRTEYESSGIDVGDLDPDPIVQFKAWLRVAVAAELTEANAMVVATVDGDGQPWSRYVLLKAASENGFDFYTNYESNKSVQLAASGRAALTFGWLELRRQVNVAGRVERVPAAEADAYWEVRPRGSQVGSWASPQSRPLVDRQELLDRVVAVDAAHRQEAVPRPAHWGGWRVRPHTIEFWQGRQNRLHDRIRYTREGEGWRVGRLAP